MATALLLAACSTPKNITYFQDVTPQETVIPMQSVNEIKIQPKDKLSILVSSQDYRLTNMFNLPIITQQVGSVSTSQNSQARGLSGYTVDSEGNIDFPVVGKIHVAGKTREEVGLTVKEELTSRDLVKEPVVTVEFMNLSVSVLGEVSEPGRYNIDKDNFTLLDAISQAGDLTIYGRRENVLVVRSENGQQKVYSVDLCSAESLYTSPAYYLQQYDVVYVEPNNERKRQSTVNGNTVRSTAFWLSVVSVMLSMATLLWK